MDENFAYWSASFNERGKWSSAFLVLGIDFVVDIADKLSTDMPPCRGCARCDQPSYFQPTWWAHNPQVHWIKTWPFFTTQILMCPLHLASYVIHELYGILCFILV